MFSPSSLPLRVNSLGDVHVLDNAARHHYTSCGSGRIVWRCWGEGRPVVLLHGGAGSWTHWVRNVAALSHQGRCVWAPDLPGFGDSAAPVTGGDADAVADCLSHSFRELFGNRQIDVVGFSFGALVAGFLAVRTPSLLSQVVLVGAPALSDSPSPVIDLRPWNRAEPGEDRRAVHRHNLSALMLFQDRAIDELAVTLHAENVVRDRMTGRRLIFGDALLRLLPQIQCPVAGVWGAEDAIYRNRLEVIGNALTHAPRMQQLAIIAQTGHWVQYERPETFNEILGRILDLSLPSNDSILV